jgi:hypothetical protein
MMRRVLFWAVFLLFMITMFVTLVAWASSYMLERDIAIRKQSLTEAEYNGMLLESADPEGAEYMMHYIAIRGSILSGVLLLAGIAGQIITRKKPMNPTG